MIKVQKKGIKLNNFIKKELSKEDLLKLSLEDVIVVDVEEDFSDFAIFLSYNQDTGEIICIDGLFKGKPNIGTYYKCYKYIAGNMLNSNTFIDVLSRE